MKTQGSWALALLLLLPALAPAADPVAEPAASSRIASAREPTYRSIDISELIEKVAKRTGKQFIVDPRVRAEVPLIGLDVDKVDYARLLAILSVHLFATYESNGVVRVVPDANARQFPVPVTNQVSPKALDDELVTVILHAKNVCAAQLVPVLRPLMPQSAHLAAMAQANTLLIVDRAANARKIIDMIDQLDKAVPADQRCTESKGSG
ncbi:MAG TPA: secretin N-terminal domain-containing protein [Steroidobacteraceae bacterium]|jgi:general secretion pathway protein D|nr:secretin N-terminal domain-containing protein [Steroidobacteraceae bacterium]